MRTIALVLTAIVVVSTVAAPAAASSGDGQATATVTASQSAEGQITNQSRAVTFVKNVEEMKGHLAVSVQWKQRGNDTEAIRHSNHPVGNYWNLIGPAVTAADSEFASALETTLSDLPSKAESMNASEYSTYVNETIVPKLDETVETTVTAEARSGVAFDGAVVNALLSRLGDEYNAGVRSDGTIDKIGEYWDARGFILRVDARYNARIEGELSTEDAAEIQEFIDTIHRAMKDQVPPSELAPSIENTRHEIAEYTGAEEEGEESEGNESGNERVQEVEAIKSDLDEVVEEYEAGESAEAKRIITQTYLNRFEGLEGPLIEERPELVEELEADFNEELPGLIDSNASVSEVESKVESMKTKLDTAGVALSASGSAEVEITERPSTTTADDEQPASTTESANTTADSGPGFGLVVALLALVAVGLLAGRRRTA